jgi:hypothetical protein
LRRLAALRRQIELIQRRNERLLAERNVLLAQLADSGVPRTDLARATGLTAGRITQLLDRDSADASTSDVQEVGGAV